MKNEIIAVVPMSDIREDTNGHTLQEAYNLKSDEIVRVTIRAKENCAVVQTFNLKDGKSSWTSTVAPSLCYPSESILRKVHDYAWAHESSGHDDETGLSASVELCLEGFVFESLNLPPFHWNFKRDIVSMGELGSGTGGSVQEGTLFGNPCAVKKINNLLEMNYEPEEVKVISMLHNDRFIKFYCTWIERNCECRYASSTHICTDLGSRSLRSYLDDRTENDLHLENMLMKQLVEAIEHMHNENIIHRDIKPENILLDRNDNIKLCDFGNATIIVPDNLCHGGRYGTDVYIAPELDKLDPHNAKVDVYSLRMVYFELFTPSFPFISRRHQQQLIRKKLTAAPTGMIVIWTSPGTSILLTGGG